MTNQEAIEIIKSAQAQVEWEYPMDYAVAFDMAISALEKQESSETQKTLDTISRQAAIDEIEYEIEMINSALDSITLDFNARERLRQRRGEAREILNSIQQLPSA